MFSLAKIPDLPALQISEADEMRLRTLANELAKGIEDEDDLIARLGLTRDHYNELAQTRTFKAMLAQATSEWEGASNTHKRIKLKAAVNIEQALPSFYTAMVDPKEPLSSRVKVMEVVSRIGQLGMPENAPQGNGQYFKLEINLGDSRPPIVIENRAAEGEEAVTPRVTVPSGASTLPLDARPIQSKLWDGMKGDL